MPNAFFNRGVARSIHGVTLNALHPCALCHLIPYIRFEKYPFNGWICFF